MCECDRGFAQQAKKKRTQKIRTSKAFPAVAAWNCWDDGMTASAKKCGASDGKSVEKPV